MIQENPSTGPSRLEPQATATAHLAKYLRRQVRSEFKRIAFQIEFMLLFDPRSERELERFHVLEPLNHFFESEYGSSTALPGSNGNLIDFDQVMAVAKPIPTKAARRSLKLMRRQLITDLCRLVEKAQLLRVLDPTFEIEVTRLGWTRALDTIARWHAMGGWSEDAAPASLDDN
jgi:hypothetical protein